MDVQLAQQVVTFLAPFLPSLIKAGDKAVEKVGEKMGEAGWEQAQALWSKLRGKVEAKPAALEAVQDLAATPDDPDAQAALRLQLRKLLAEDPALAAGIAALLKKAQAAGVNVTASGNRSVAIGGDVSGSTIITGDGNKVWRGK